MNNEYPTTKWLINNLRSVGMTHKNLKLLMLDAADRIQELDQEVHDRSADCESYCCTIDIEMELRGDAEAEVTKLKASLEECERQFQKAQVDIATEMEARQKMEIELERQLTRLLILQDRHKQDVEYASRMTQTWYDVTQARHMIWKVDEIANTLADFDWCECGNCAPCQINDILRTER